jgi:hypothetical protein
MTYDPFDPFNALIEETDPAVLAEGHRWVQQHFYGETMYTDYFLKFNDADEANEVLFDDERPKYAAIDVIGQIYKATGQTVQTDDGENYYTSDVMESVPGWHVNVRHNDEALELEQYRVHPATPQRMWA